MTEQLDKHLRKFSTAPILFVGSGISRRYLNAPTWEALLKHFAGMTDRPYEYYRATGGGTNLPAIATEIARAFHQLWWKGAEFEPNRKAYASDALQYDSALKIEIAALLGKMKATTDPAMVQEMTALKEAVVDGVITTNWDLFLESVFPDFTPYVGQDQLLFTAHHGIGEIYKIHGSIAAPNSLVLTDNDYQRFNQRNRYLAAKLLTAFVEHPVIFLGYSLGDPNVAEILGEIGACLTSENIGQLRDRLIFVSWKPDATELQMSSSNLVIHGGITIPIVEVRTRDFLPIFDILKSLPRTFPAKVLRQLKERVYELVKESNPKGKLYVKDIDAATSPNDVEVVFGVGAISAIRTIGYTGLTRIDLIDDVLDESGGFNALDIVSKSLPELLKQPKYLPIFRYLRLAGYLDGTAIDSNKASQLSPAVLTYAKREYKAFSLAAYEAKAKKLLNKHKTFEAVAAAESVDDVLTAATSFPKTAFSPQALKQFLLKNRSVLKKGNSLQQSQFIKLVCIYDWIESRKT